MLIQDKLDLIDHFFQHYPVKTFAELGCSWGVDGGYGFHILDHYEVSRAVQVDSVVTEKMKEKAGYPQLQVIQRNFCDDDVPKLVGDVDVVILFDVLLHQVKPDWDGLLEMYAPHTKHFLIYNQQWISSVLHTARLLDFGREEYFKKIPAGSENFKSYIGLFDRLDQAIPADPGRLFCNSINVWQWGITDADLITKLAELGFNLQYFKNCGQAFGLSDFENHGFLFSIKCCTDPARVTG